MNELLEYNEVTGVLFWKDNRGRVKKGDQAGYVLKHHSGKYYRMVQINGKAMYAHRVAWELKTGCKPKMHIDHIDGDGLNNSFSNLRLVSSSDNAKNLKVYKNNKTGVMGVTRFRGKYKSTITEGGVTEHLGVFDNLFDACCARKSRERDLSFHLNHGSSKSANVPAYGGNQV